MEKDRQCHCKMYAYLTRYDDVGTVILLYPHHDGIGGSSGSSLETWHLEKNTEKKLRVYSIHYEDETKAIAEITEMIQRN
jgi:5-methylcytosine-specific restriction enzyme subunit McrC